jgi:hypothetical protein
MNRRMRSIGLAIALCALLGACAAPPAPCGAAADRDLAALDALIAETEANIARGYAVRPDRSRTIAFGGCTGNGRSRGGVGITICGSREVPLGTTPVAIDPDAERAKLAGLRRQRDERAAAAAAERAQCAARPSA